MAKPATTRGQPRSERKGRPPRPDPPLLRRPLPLPTPETRRRRSLRPRRPLQILKDEDYGFDREGEEDEEEEEEEEEGRGLKKLRLVVKLHRSPVGRETTRVGRTRRPAVVPPTSSSSSSPSPASSSSSYVGDDEPEEEGDEEEQTVKPPKKRKIEVCTAVGGRSGKQEDRKKNISYRSSGNSGTLAPSRSGTLMPERTELESILDKLQKKDTYGAFAEPVDPEELPDYHDVIEHPMDFGTIRKKLARVAYRSFEQFEDDVFLICSNAMQYNAPDTVYFRQASSIQDMAQKIFQKIRNNTKSTEADHRSEEKVRLSTMEKKMPETQHTQQAKCKAILEPLTSDISSGATLASAGDTFTRLSTVNSIDKSVAVNGFVDGNSSLGESKQEKGDEFSVKCSPSKLGRKSAPVDENRRETYSITPEQEPLAETDLILNLFEDDQKQLVPAGPEAEYSYARSLARFAVSLGPVAWEIVSQKIEKALPPGMKYGPGWVGEYEPLPRPFLSLENCNKQHTGKAISESRAATKDKVTELKSNAGQNPISSKKQHELKKQLIGGIPRKASVPIESTSCRNSMEQKPSFLGADSTVPLRINGTGQEKHSNDSNNLNSGFSNPVNSANCSVASVRVKEESPSEETTERSQVVFCANGKTQRSTEKGLHRKKNHEKRESTIAKAFTKTSQQGMINNPSPNGSHSNLSGIVLREGNDLQTKNQKELPTASFQTHNNILGMAIGGLSNGIRPNNNFAFSSSNQARVNYGLGLVNNRDQASIDPFRLVGFSGKVTNQENVSSSGVNGMSYLEKPISIVSSLARENYGPATSKASKAWISAGTAMQWKSVDSKSSSGEPITTPPFCNNSNWKPTTSIQVNGDSMVRPGNLPIQVFDEASNVKNRGLVIFPQLITTDVSKHQSHPPWQLLSPQPRSKQRDNLPPDLNIGYQPPGSPVQQPSANLAMDSQQPDLALQL